MPQRPATPVGLAIIAVCLFWRLPASAETDALVAALRQRPPDRLLECTFDSGQFARGYLVRIQADSLLLRTEAAGGLSSSHALADIAQVREWRASTGRGARWGAATGAVAVGAFGALVGMVVSGLDGDSHDDFGPIFGGALLGAGAGYLGGGILGSGVGALINGWYPVWPVDRDLPRLPLAPAPRSQRTRVGVFAGTARSLLDDYEVHRFTGRVGVHKILNDNVSLGPDFAYFDFDDPIVTHGPTFTAVRSREHLLMFALVTTVQPRLPVMAPYGTLGVGWYLSNQDFVGVQVGGGLRFHVERGADLDLDLRHHFALSHVGPTQVDRFWTLGVGLGFGD